jgi:hypothetical protein
MINVLVNVAVVVLIGAILEVTNCLDYDCGTNSRDDDD